MCHVKYYTELNTYAMSRSGFPRDPRLANMQQSFSADPRVRPTDPRTQNKLPRECF